MQSLSFIIPSSSAPSPRPNTSFEHRNQQPADHSPNFDSLIQRALGSSVRPSTSNGETLAHPLKRPVGKCGEPGCRDDSSESKVAKKAEHAIKPSSEKVDEEIDNPDDDSDGQGQPSEKPHTPAVEPMMLPIVPVAAAFAPEKVPIAMNSDSAESINAVLLSTESQIVVPGSQDSIGSSDAQAVGNPTYDLADKLKLRNFSDSNLRQKQSM